jgi:DNA-binding NarL/FixJ family response regulator
MTTSQAFREASMHDPSEPIGVVLVDDHVMFAQSLARLLADETGIQVLGLANNATQALRMARDLHPNVMLIDYQMPDQNGVTIATEIKTINPEIMIVMLTGTDDDKVLVAAIDAGCSGFLTKDRAAHEVADAIRGVAEGEALISPALLARLLPKLKRTYRTIGDDLTDRELDVLHCVAKGWAGKAIANELHLSLNTIRNYTQSILSKLNAHSKLEAVAIAVREGIIAYPSGE